MKVTFELSNNDIKHFREVLQRVRERAEGSEESVVVDGAESLVRDVLGSEVPDFVRDRITKLDELIRMLRDEEWRLEGSDRARVLNALAYFVDPDDLIPDKVPGIGYLDDAIMVELVVQELRHEIEAYEDFCEYRKARDVDPEKLEARRRTLQTRMRRRRRSDRQRRRARSPGRSIISLW